MTNQQNNHNKIYYEKLKNQSIKLWLSLLFLVILTPIRAFSASSVGINGLYYELNSSSNTAKVVYDSSYSSLPVSVIIPESVEYNGATYSVTEIGQSAFSAAANWRAFRFREVLPTWVKFILVVHLIIITQINIRHVISLYLRDVLLLKSPFRRWR